MSLAANDVHYRGAARRQRGVRRSDLSASMVEITCIAGLLVLYLFADALFGEEGHLFVNLAGPIGLALIMIANAYFMINGNGKILWTALFWYRLSTAAYFGIGSAMVYLVNDNSRTRMEGFFQFSDQDIFKMNLVVAFSVLLVLIASRIGVSVYRRLPAARRRAVQKRANYNGRTMLGAALVFLIIGLSVNYTVVIPYRMGWSGIVLPGSLANFAQFTPIGIFLILLWSRRHARSLLLPILALVFVEMIMSLLMFMKSPMLMLLIMVSLAFLWDRVSAMKLAFFGAIVVLAFMVISPVVSDARYEITQRYGANKQAGFAERFDILSDSITEQAPRVGLGNQQDALLRLSYVNAATFLIQLYDTGLASDWPKLIPAVFVPRVLWPGKPIISDIGLDIYELSSGRRTSSSGAGLFAEAYWAQGWLGVFVFMPIYGLIIGFLSHFTVDALRDEKWLYAPVILMALYMGFRTDGHYISDVVGASVILVFLYIVLRVTETLVRSFFTTSVRLAPDRRGTP